MQKYCELIEGQRLTVCMCVRELVATLSQNGLLAIFSNDFFWTTRKVTFLRM